MSRMLGPPQSFSTPHVTWREQARRGVIEILCPPTLAILTKRGGSGRRRPVDEWCYVELLRNFGLSFAEIGTAFDVTPERARQIYYRHRRHLNASVKHGWTARHVCLLIPNLKTKKLWWEES